MNKLFKNLILIALLGVSLVIDKASAAVSYSHPLSVVWLSSSSGGYAGTNIYSGPFLLSSVTLQNTNTTAQRVQFYDSSSAALQVVANMVSFTSYSSNKVTSFTTFGGNTQNNTNTVWFTTKNAAADITSWKASPANLSVPASGSGGLITYTFDPPIQMYSGISLTNTAIGITVTITGDPGP